MKEDKRKREWCRVPNNIRFLILIIPRSSDCQKPFRGFSEILLHNISYEFTSFFPYFDQNKNPRKKNILSFCGIPYWRRPSKNLRIRTTYFLVWVWHRWSVGLMKSKIVKVKLFENYLTHHLPAITEYSIFLGHPYVYVEVWKCILYEVLWRVSNGNNNRDH